MAVMKRNADTTENKTAQLSVQEVLGLARAVNMWIYRGEYEGSGPSTLDQAGKYTGSIKICRGEVRIELVKSHVQYGKERGFEYTIAAFNSISMLSSKTYSPADASSVKEYYDTLHEKHPMIATLRRYGSSPTLDEMTETEKVKIIREFLAIKRLL